MMAKIIVVTNQKGGSGKTTVTMNLAGALARHEGGRKVMVIDADPQGTATRWAASAPDESPFPATLCGLSAAGSKVHREVRKYLSDYHYILVDCPPAVDSAVPQSALLVADLAIVPIIPSPPDLWAGIGIRELIHQQQDLNEELQARLVPNMCQPHTVVAQEALSLLDEFGIPMTQTKMHLRTAYRQSAVYGTSVHHLPGSGVAAAKIEIEDLLDEVLGLITVEERQVA